MFSKRFVLILLIAIVEASFAVAQRLPVSDCDPSSINVQRPISRRMMRNQFDGGGVSKRIGGHSPMSLQNSSKTEDELQFTPLGVPMRWVNCVAVDGDDVYIGGNFDLIDTVAYSNVVRWNRTTRSWDSLDGGADDQVFAMQIVNGSLYVTGYFKHIGGIAANGIARYDLASKTWSALGEGLTGYGETMTAISNRLYVGGDFTSAGGVAASNIAWYEPATSTWHPLGNGVEGEVWAMAGDRDTLYVGGTFGGPGGTLSGPLARWYGDRWESLRIPDSIGFSSFAAHDGRLFVAGPAASGIGCWQAGRWTRIPLVGSSRSSFVIDVWGLIYHRDTLWLGGENGMSALDVRTGQSTVVSGIAGGCHPTVANDELMAVGWFGSTDSTNQFRNVASYSKGRWRSVVGITSRTLDGTVRAMVADGDDIYVGGDFRFVGMRSFNHIASWDAQTRSWSPLGDGAPGQVMALANHGDSIFCCGYYLDVTAAQREWAGFWDKRKRRWVPAPEIGLPSVSSIGAEWIDDTLYLAYGRSAKVLRNGQWDPLPAVHSSGGTLRSLVNLDGSLVVGGTFAGSPNYGVKRWNGSAWEKFASSDSLTFGGLCEFRSDLYAWNNNGVYHYSSRLRRWTLLPTGDFVPVSISANADGVYVGCSHRADQTRFMVAKVVADSVVVIVGDVRYRLPYGSGSLDRILTTSRLFAFGGYFHSVGLTPIQSVAIADRIAERASILFSFDELEFGTHAIGNVSERSFTITNADTSTGDIAGTVSLDTGAFEIVSGGGDFSIAPGEGHTVVVRYLARWEGSDTALVGIVHSATNRGTMAVRLVGRTSGVSVVDDPPSDGTLQLVASPMPVNGTGMIRFVLPGGDRYELELIDARGGIVDRLASGVGGGVHSISWNAASLPSGTYLLRLRYGPMRIVRPIAVVR